MSTPSPDRDLTKLAPKFGLAVLNAINECHLRGLDVVIYEGLRSDALQKLYYERGVTKARSAQHSWHGFGLAVDVISQEHRWGADEDWWLKVAKIFKANGLDWGGDWKFVDKPHFQWGRCKASPSDVARSLYASGGLKFVWQAVGAA